MVAAVCLAAQPLAAQATLSAAKSIDEATAGPASGASVGGLRGITRNPSGNPLPEVNVTVHRTDGSVDKTTTSGADGAFSLDGFGQSKWHRAWEAWYQYQRRAPNVNDPAAAPLLITNAGGAYCKNDYQVTCFAPEWATVNYVSKQVGKKDAPIFRNEYFDDMRGQRTGFKSKYTTHTVAWNHWIGSTVAFRPELRYDIAYNAPAYDSGLKRHQLMFAAY